MKSLYILPIFLVLFSCVQAKKQPEQKPVKYIFLCIGDGMGPEQMKAADLYLRETTGDSLNIMYLPSCGTQITRSANSKITCSSAAGTALATGVKTNNGQLGISPSGDTLFSVAKAAKAAGMKVGIISSVSIDHATPAAFYANNISRSNYHEISTQLATSNFDFFGGGGFKNPQKDSVNAYELAKEAGYTLYSSEEDFAKIPKCKKLFVYDKDTVLPFGIDNENDLKLKEITELAISRLENENGFFIMVEGGKIDWACHENDLTTAIHETIEFNEAVKSVLEFYKKHKDETLIIVTADHETGGMKIDSKNTNFSILQNQSISYGKLGWILKSNITPSFTFNDYMDTLAKYYKFNVEGGIELTKEDVSRLQKTYDFVTDSTIKCSKKTKRLYNISENSCDNRTGALAVVPNAIIGKKAGLSWTTYAHTGTLVPIKAIGVNSQHFGTQIENTDIAKYIFSMIKK